MFNEIIKSTKLGQSELTITTGKIARQSDGAVMARIGDTIVLCTVVFAKKIQASATFFPLTVHYREMAYAAGKVPGGFIKREGKASDREILISRLIDRSIRPLFSENFRNETQVICTLLSYDPEHSPDIVAMIGTYAALSISGIPNLKNIASVRVGNIGGEFVLNPSAAALTKSSMDIVISGTLDSIYMVEAGAHESSEEDTIKAIEFGQSSFKNVIALIEEFKNAASKDIYANSATKSEENNSLEANLKEKFGALILKSFDLAGKDERTLEYNKIWSSICLEYSEIDQNILADIFDKIKSEILVTKIFETKKRIGGRNLDEIRQIECEVGLLPRVHGSALFTRGETQSIGTITLGTSSDEQIIDSIEGSSREHFMLHYIFPPYSVGETSAFRAPGRREVGHGRLAWRAILNALPKQGDFPYSIRAVSEITESNGSSSMATVCSISLALLNANVPIKNPVAGIAMGLLMRDKKYVILSDILGDEDYLGDMDFKVAGTKNGITALQMDIKVGGINVDIIKDALAQAKTGRMHILDIMHKSLENKLHVTSKFAPVIDVMKISKDKIRDLIGPGGRVIKEICEKASCKIDTADDGTITISASSAIGLEIAKDMITAVAFDPKIGDIFEGTVVKVVPAGAFVNYIGSKDGFLHISEISNHKIENINNYLKQDQKVEVKVVGFDKGRVRLSMKHKIKTEDSALINTRTENTKHNSHKDNQIEKEKELDNDSKHQLEEQSTERNNIDRPKKIRRNPPPKQQKSADDNGDKAPAQETEGFISETKYFN
ncbi:MAG: polyribonucleotide nucleotidyltransferase [Rickettsiaceae bacterium]|nr:polyribonucleotide nucleotidyltransferase [Rickettsiaceae bacterium]